MEGQEMPKNNFDSMLDSNKVSTVTKKTSKVPTIPTKEIPKNVAQATKDFVDLKKKQKELEAEVNAVSSTIIGFASNYQDTKAFDGNFSKSWNVEEIQYGSVAKDQEKLDAIRTLVKPYKASLK